MSILLIMAGIMAACERGDRTHRVEPSYNKETLWGGEEEEEEVRTAIAVGAAFSSPARVTATAEQQLVIK